MSVLEVHRRMGASLRSFRPGAPCAWVYHPLDYAWGNFERYVTRYVRPGPEILFVGMNPGPHGMTQTGVPFGDPTMVRTFLHLDGPVGAPDAPCPKVPVRGIASTRKEGSGTRLWGWVADRFGTAEAFAERFAILSWCPLLFLDAAGRNLVPERLAPADRRVLYPICDAALAEVVRSLQPRRIVAFGVFAEARCHAAGLTAPITRVLHPSPASPAANRGWAAPMDALIGR